MNLLDVLQRSGRATPFRSFSMLKRSTVQNISISGHYLGGGFGMIDEIGWEEEENKVLTALAPYCSFLTHQLQL